VSQVWIEIDLKAGDGDSDGAWMLRALELARAAAAIGEVPVGAVVVQDGLEVGRGGNRRETDRDPLAHAEILALRQAAARVGGWRLAGCTLYVTLEPCAMCAGALVNARVERLVYGAADPKAGYCGTLGNLVQDPRLNHRLAVTAGIFEAECAAVLREFFAGLRGARSAN
jgi:tRNA(adenine34) deaminase